MAIKRIWHGWTSLENAENYKKILFEIVFPEIESKNIPGYREIELLQNNKGDEVEFVKIMTFDSIQNIIDFQGENYQQCYVPDAAKEVLKRWDRESKHFEFIKKLKYT